MLGVGGEDGAVAVSGVVGDWRDVFGFQRDVFEGGGCGAVVVTLG